MNIGYACLTIGVNGAKITGCKLGSATRERLNQVAEDNLSALEAILRYNAAQGIRLFRISSDIIPFASHPVIRFPWRSFFAERLGRIGEYAKENRIRVSMHPGQYTVLNSRDEAVRSAAVADLEYHSDFLDALGVDGSHKIILHAGGVYGDRQESLERFAREAAGLPENVLARLVVENDDTRFPVQDILSLSEMTGLPVVFDNLHHKVEPSPELDGLSDSDVIRLCARTWRPSDGRQKVHYSQQRQGGAPGAHSGTISLDSFMAWQQSLGEDPPDVMLEVKDKNLSAMKCVLALAAKLNPARLEGEWARYKYTVLEHDAAAYNGIRQLLKDKEAIWRNADDVVARFYRYVDGARELPENKGAAVNALQHVWGYVRNDATDAELKRWHSLMDGYKADAVPLAAVKNHLHKCAVRQSRSYLTDSLYFSI
jgi:UV DNA damage endonuclease